ncbi:MAG: transporter substrate-binding domain-containing protein [Bradyrhizobiaceae bacterium]|nr:MAG: transporter substrate-binding domain-containing protein [Bradyrhizobiaceae bacterium]
MRLADLLNATRRGMLRGLAAASFASILILGNPAMAAEPLKVGYSDWPGWVAWQVAIDKGWFKEAGVDVDFEWFDYSASMDAFSAGKLDGVTVTNGDALVMGGTGARSVMIMLTDYSNGNDIIVGKPGIKSLADLKGKKVGIEVGLVEHLLLINGLQKEGVKEDSVSLVNTKTNETPQVLASGDVAAIGAWQPIAGQAMKGAPGAHPLYTSAKAPGLIYDVVTVSPASLAARKADWTKLVAVWDKVVAYINDPKTQADAVKIMAAKVGVPPEDYAKLLGGTKLLTLAEGKKIFVDAEGLGSLYGSSRNADAFNVKFDVYKEHQDVKTYIDPTITNSLVK